MEKTANANVAIVNSFFVEKFDVYMKEFLKKSMNIKAYWLSYEWAKRGTIHVHCLWWVEDQPNIIEALNCKDKNKQMIMLKDAVNW